MKKVTLRDVAEACGLTRAAVSMALRNISQIPACTRLRVKKAAKKIGYRSDPELAKVLAQVRASGRFQKLETIAYLNPHPDLKIHQHSDYAGRLWSGAQQRAEQLGYRLELISLREPNMTNCRLNQILVARGIRGVLIAPSKTSLGHLSLDWKRLVAVALSATIAYPILNRIIPYQHQVIQLALHELHKRRIDRIGLLTTQGIHQRNPIWNLVMLGHHEKKNQKKKYRR